jgi:two-component sensor histidine kinase/PAS domain-containing protein
MTRVQQIAEIISKLPSDGFFSHLTELLARELNANLVLVSEFFSSKLNIARTLSYNKDGKEYNSVEFSLNDTPCNDVIKKIAPIVSNDIRAIYPNSKLLNQTNAISYIGVPLLENSDKAIGSICLICDKPTEDLDFSLLVMTFAALRASSELVRVREARQYQTTNRQLTEILLNTPSDGAYLIHKDGTIMILNEAAANKINIPIKEAVGKNIFELTDPQIREAKRDHINQVVKSKQPKTMTGFVNGSFLRSTTYPVVDEDGSVNLLSIFIQDLTDMYKVENALKDSEAVNKAIVDSINGFIYTCTNDYTVNFANQKLVHYLGSSPIGKKCHQAIFNNPERCQWCDENTAFKGETTNFEILDTARDRWYYVIFTPKTSPNGTLSHQTLMFDITDYKKTEEELERLNKKIHQEAQSKTELLKEVNHRVKNNLVAILGLLAVEQHYVSNNDKQLVRDVVETISQRISSMLETHKMLSESQWSPVNLSELSERIINNSALSHSVKTVPYSCNVEKSSIAVSPRQSTNIALIFNELVTNSMKYFNNHADEIIINVKFNIDDNYISIIYSDNGPGFPDNILNKNDWNVGLSLIEKLVKGTLRGKMNILNKNGAKTIIFIKLEEPERT